MEPVTLTASAIASLAFYKFLEVGSEKVAEKFTSEAIAKMEELRQKIWQRFSGKPPVEKALQKLEQGEKSELERLSAYLQVAMDEDPDFAAKIKQLAQAIDSGKRQDNSNLTQINRDNAKGWQTKVEGGTAYVGEIHINQK